MSSRLWIQSNVQKAIRWKYSMNMEPLNATNVEKIFVGKKYSSLAKTKTAKKIIMKNVNNQRATI